MKIITLLPCGGLCNRLRAIISALTFTKENEIELQVLWKNNEDCAADFLQLFKPINSSIFSISIANNDLINIRPSKNNLFIPALSRLFHGEYKTYFVDTSPSNIGLTDRLIPKIFRKDQNDRALSKYIKDGNNFIITCSSLTKDWRKGPFVFEPVDKLLNSIDQFSEQFSENTIGIHIRRTDNRISINKSPMELFYRKIDTEIINNDKVNFFIASDSIPVKDDLIIRYGNKILSTNFPIERNSLNGMESAVIELWCLSRTNRIWGSCYSSYSNIASMISGIPLERVTT